MNIIYSNLKLLFIRILFRLLSTTSSKLAGKRRFEVCIYKVDGIGDFILASASIRKLVDGYGPSQCLLLIDPAVQELAEMEFPDTPQIIVPRFGYTSIRRALQAWFVVRPVLARYHFKQLICLRYPSEFTREVVLSWISAENSFGIHNSELSAGSQNGGFSPYRFDSVIEYPSSCSSDEICREIETHRCVLEKVLSMSVEVDQVLPTLRSVDPMPGEYLLVSPFASSQMRSILPETFALAIWDWWKKAQIPIRLCGTESAGLIELRTLLTTRGIKDLKILPTPTLESFFQAIAQARGVLTVETSTAHIATALNKPTVVVMSGGHYGILCPWSRSDKQIWLTHKMDCFGCDFNCVYHEPLCVRSVKAEDIAHALLDVCKEFAGGYSK